MYSTVLFWLILNVCKPVNLLRFNISLLDGLPFIALPFRYKFAILASLQLSIVTYFNLEFEDKSILVSARKSDSVT
nr:MAG TPA: hypothetical protein [Crassvirales sp.]